MPTHRRLLIVLCFAVLLLAVGGAAAQGDTPLPLPTPAGDYTIYTVQYGDTLSMIALRFGVSTRTLIRANRLGNANFIKSGQILYIPTENLPFVEASADGAEGGDAQIATPATAEIPPVEATPATTEIPPVEATPATTEIPPVEATPSAQPQGEQPAQTPAGSELPQEEPPLPEGKATPVTPAELMPTTASEVSALSAIPPQPMQFGIELFSSPEGAAMDAAVSEVLGARWVKVMVDWGEMEAVPGIIDYTNLDPVVDVLAAQQFQILLTISGAPGWTRSTQEESGPPDDMSLFADFLVEFASHYIGRVSAYEIWNEPNLRREWNSAVNPLSALSYAQMLQSAYTAIRSVDSSVQIISAGLAPTGIDDGFNAINDRRFIAELMQAGLSDFADGIGMHPFGFAIPPEFTCCEAPEGVESHTGDPSFYFSSMLQVYSATAASASPALPLWVTAFGWGIAEPGTDVPRNFAYVTYNTPEEQSAFTLAALDLAKEIGAVRVMILSNLNGCSVETTNAEICYLSINPPGGAPRPVYEALRQRAQAEG